MVGRIEEDARSRQGEEDSDRNGQRERMREMGGQGKKEMRNRSLLQDNSTRLQKPKPGRLRKDTGCLIPCQAGLRDAKQNEKGIVWSDLEGQTDEWSL